MEKKDALMTYCGVHYRSCILPCVLLRLGAVPYASFGCFGEYDPRNILAFKMTRANNHMR